MGYISFLAESKKGSDNSKGPSGPYWDHNALKKFKPIFNLKHRSIIFALKLLISTRLLTQLKKIAVLATLLNQGLTVALKAQVIFLNKTRLPELQTLHCLKFLVSQAIFIIIIFFYSGSALKQILLHLDSLLLCSRVWT